MVQEVGPALVVPVLVVVGTVLGKALLLGSILALANESGFKLETSLGIAPGGFKLGVEFGVEFGSIDVLGLELGRELCL